MCFTPPDSAASKMKDWGLHRSHQRRWMQFPRRRPIALSQVSSAGTRRMARASTGRTAAGAVLPVVFFTAGSPSRQGHRLAMRSCSALPLRRSPPSPPIPGIWTRKSASPRCSIRSTIRTFIAWCQAVAPRSTACAGSFAAPASFENCRRRKSTGGSNPSLARRRRRHGSVGEPCLRLRPSTEAFGKQAGDAKYSNVITLAV